MLTTTVFFFTFFGIIFSCADKIDKKGIVGEKNVRTYMTTHNLQLPKEVLQEVEKCGLVPGKIVRNKFSNQGKDNLLFIDYFKKEDLEKVGNDVSIKEVAYVRINLEDRAALRVEYYHRDKPLWVYIQKRTPGEVKEFMNKLGVSFPGVVMRNITSSNMEICGDGFSGLDWYEVNFIRRNMVAEHQDGFIGGPDLDMWVCFYKSGCDGYRCSNFTTRQKCKCGEIISETIWLD